MTYEIGIAFKTVKTEGLASLWRKFVAYLADIRDSAGARVPGDLTVEQYVDHFMGDKVFHASQSRGELLRVARLVAYRRPRTVLEIGTAKGGSLALWCRLAHPEARVVSVDLPCGLHGGGYPAWRGVLYSWLFPRAGQDLTLLRADSHSAATVAAVRRMFPDGIDFVFHDGEHTEEGGEADFASYFPMLSPRGIFVLCDVSEAPTMPDVTLRRFYLRVKDRHHCEEVVDDPGAGAYGMAVFHERRPE